MNTKYRKILNARFFLNFSFPKNTNYFLKKNSFFYLIISVLAKKGKILIGYFQKYFVH